MLHDLEISEKRMSIADILWHPLGHNPCGKQQRKEFELIAMNRKNISIEYRMQEVSKIDSMFGIIFVEGPCKAQTSIVLQYISKTI